MPLYGMPVSGSRLAEVEQLLELMAKRGVSHLKVGDLELTLAQSAPPQDEQVSRRVYSPEELRKKAQDEYKRIALGSGGRVVPRASE